MRWVCISSSVDLRLRLPRGIADSIACMRDSTYPTLCCSLQCTPSGEPLSWQPPRRGSGSRFGFMTEVVLFRNRSCCCRMRPRLPGGRRHPATVRIPDIRHHAPSLRLCPTSCYPLALRTAGYTSRESQRAPLVRPVCPGAYPVHGRAPRASAQRQKGTMVGHFVQALWISVLSGLSTQLRYETFVHNGWQYESFFGHRAETQAMFSLPPGSPLCAARPNTWQVIINHSTCSDGL